MVLSSYFNWQTDVPMYERKTVEAESETQLVAADGLECYWNAFELPYTFPASYLDPQNYSSLLPLYDSLVSFPPEVIPYETLSSYPCPKRHKLIEDHYFSDLMPGVFDGVTVSQCPVLEDHHQTVNQINLEGMKTVGNCNKISEEKCASVQSIAARERRRKITKRTQELGKLVPGGSKMNTAEMLQSAFKYIKYLQAQVGILQVMDSFPENEKRSWDGKMEMEMEMVTSPKVQEKLYMEDKCLVPKDVVVSLTTHFKPPLCHELTRLLSLPSND